MAASVSIGYEHKTSLEGRSGSSRSSDPVLHLFMLHPPGEDQDQSPGATHQFCERCPSRRHEYDFEQYHRASQHLAEHGKMRERASVLLNPPDAAAPAMLLLFHTGDG
jgi:hypothetical protein